MIKNVFLGRFCYLLHVCKDFVLFSEMLMAFEVVDEVSLSVFSKKVEVYTDRPRRPFKIE